MFTSGHFIWLGAIAIVITAALVTVKKLNPSNSAVQKTVAVLLAASKLFHISLSMKNSDAGGMVLRQEQLSFHLCSMMIYFVIFTSFMKNEKIVKTVKSFMVPAMLIGASMALLIPTAGVDPATPRVWEYMLAHCTLVFYGIYLMAIEKVDLSLRAYINNLKFLAVFSLVAFAMNSILEPYETNFMFLREPPVEGLPILNLDNGWFVYFLSLVTVACSLVLLVQLPFIISEIKQKRKNKLGTADKTAL